MRVYTSRVTGERLLEGQAFFDGSYYRPAEFLARASAAELEQANVAVTEAPDLPVAAPIAADVDRERDTRMLVVPFQGHRYDYIDGRGSDMNIAGASTLALGAIIKGVQPGDLRWVDPERDFAWVTSDNISVPMDAETVYALGQAAATWKARHIWAARALKDMAPIPADFRDNRWWP